MNITAWRRGAAIVFELHGDLAAGHDRPGTLVGLVTAATASHVILNLEDVRRLDCTGIGELIRLQCALEAEGVHPGARQRGTLPASNAGDGRAPAFPNGLH